MKNRIFIYGILTILFTIIFAGCKDDSVSGNSPQVIYPSDILVIDLNEVTNPSIICVVNSEVGLESVELYIVYKDGREEQLDKITSFYNKYSYSVNVKPLFNSEMAKFKVTAIDAAGQKTNSELPLSILAMSGLPNIEFTDGTNPITSINYIEDDPTPNVYVNVSSEEELKYLVFYKVKALTTEMINDTVWFYNGEKEATVNLTTYGDGYQFEKGLTELKARVAAGSRNKTKEASVTVNFGAAVQLHINETDDLFNGLPKNGTASFSGSVETATDIASLKYQLVARDGSLLGSPINISLTGSSFNTTFTALPTLGSVLVTATASNGKSDEYTIFVHVGYKLHHLMASLSGTATQNIYTSPGCFFSAEKGRVFTYCEGKENSAFVDVGFATWSSNANIRLLSLRRDDKFRTLTECSPHSYSDGAVRDWPYRNEYDVATSSIQYADFDKSTITDIESASIGANEVDGVSIVNGFATSPSGQKVGIYQTNIGGASKKVIIAYDKLESYNSSQPILSKIWFYAKVEL